MIFSSPYRKGFPEEDFMLFYMINFILKAVDLSPSKDVVLKFNCHCVAKAVEHFFPVKMVSGYFIRSSSDGYRSAHSWCITKHGNIIDVWPVGIVSDCILIVKNHEDAYQHKRFIPSRHEEVIKDLQKTSVKKGALGLIRKIEELEEINEPAIKKYLRRGRRN